MFKFCAAKKHLFLPIPLTKKSPPEYPAGPIRYNIEPWNIQSLGPFGGKYLPQLFHQPTSARDGDAVDFLGDFFHIFHLLQLEEHFVLLHELGRIEQAPGGGRFFPAGDGIGLGRLFGVHDFLDLIQ